MIEIKKVEGMSYERKKNEWLSRKLKENRMKKKTERTNLKP